MKGVDVANRTTRMEFDDKGLNKRSEYLEISDDKVLE